MWQENDVGRFWVLKRIADKEVDNVAIWSTCGKAIS